VARRGRKVIARRKARAKFGKARRKARARQALQELAAYDMPIKTIWPDRNIMYALDGLRTREVL